MSAERVASLADYQALQDGETRRVRLSRSDDRNHRWESVFEGEVVIRTLELPANRKRSAGHLAISIETPDWAEYSTDTDYEPSTGVLLAEDYMLELLPLIDGSEGADVPT